MMQDMIQTIIVITIRNAITDNGSNQKNRNNQNDNNNTCNHRLGRFPNSSRRKHRVSLQVTACLLGLAARPFNQGRQDQYYS